MVQTNTQMPTAGPSQSAYIRPYVNFNPYTGSVERLEPIKLASGGNPTDKAQQLENEYEQMFPNSYAGMQNPAPIPTVPTRTINPSISSTDVANFLKSQPAGVSDRTLAGYVNQSGAPNEAIAGATGLQPWQVQQRYVNASSPYYDLSGQSQDAYNYLMGLGPYPHLSLIHI